MTTIAPATAPVTAAVVTPPTAMPSDALLIKLGAKPNFGAALKMPRGEDRKAAVWTALADTAAASQQPFIELAEKLKTEGKLTGYETLVSPNMLVVDPASGAAAEVQGAFQALQGVATIYKQDATPVWGKGVEAADDHGHGVAAERGGTHTGLDVFSRGAAKTQRQLGAAEPTTPYGITMVQAPEAWAANADGRGLVYGSIDTGADFTHEAIAAKYRGLAADGTVNHDYSWMDFGASRKPAPADPDQHGTHTIGTVTGGTDTMKIGVAPAAKWISAHGLTGQADVRLKALQFMQAPTKVDGSEPNPKLAPDVVGMSWWTGPNWSDFFADSLTNLVAAGIEPVKSAGNKGPGPETISSPGQFPQVIAAAAIAEDRQIADFSSRGPSPLPHHHTGPQMKPDVSAPGVDVLSSVPGNKYAKYSGTSMAQPHTAGVILDILSKYPQLSHDQLVKVLASTAQDLGARGRDLEFGHGLVNLPAALAAAEKLAGGTKPAK